MNTRLLFGLLWLTPTLCFGALSTTTSYFLNVEALTNVVARSAVRGLTGAFTNGITAGASTFTGNISASATLGSQAYNFTGFTDSGFGVGAAAPNVTGYRAGVGIFEMRAGSLNLGVNSLGFGAIGAAPTTLILGEAANTLALRNGTAAQTFNIYNTYTDASNYERGVLLWTSNTLRLGTDNLGTGTSRNLQLYTKGTGIIQFAINNTVAWNMNASGHLLAQTDNTYDIGASGATRPRHIYVAGNATAATFIGGAFAAGATSFIAWSGRGYMTSPADSIILLQNSSQNNFDRLQFGGTSASFPALKRSTTELQVRLADDSADGGLKSGSHTTTGIHVMTPSTLQTLAAANALLANAKKVRVVGSGGAVTLTSTPTIADGTDGQYVMIQGTDDTNTLTVQDQGSLASSNLELGAATRVLGAGDVLCLTFDSTASVWYEVSFANN